MKVTLLLNPRAGKKRALTVQDNARAIAKELGVSLDIQVITAPGEGTTLARQAVEMGADRVISVGGDGTLNAIASGLVGTKVPLGIVAMGSGNGYARSQRLPLDPVKALRIAMTGGASAMDVCYLNDKLFLGTAGIGFDARVAWEFDRSDTEGDPRRQAHARGGEGQQRDHRAQGADARVLQHPRVRQRRHHQPRLRTGRWHGGTAAREQAFLLPAHEGLLRRLHQPRGQEQVREDHRDA
jgi:hypothetical protein